MLFLFIDIIFNLGTKFLGINVILHKESTIILNENNNNSVSKLYYNIYNEENAK